MVIFSFTHYEQIYGDIHTYHYNPHEWPHKHKCTIMNHYSLIIHTLFTHCSDMIFTMCLILCGDSGDLKKKHHPCTCRSSHLPAIQGIQGIQGTSADPREAAAQEREARPPTNLWCNASKRVEV